MQYMTSSQKAAEWSVTRRMVNYWCANGEIEGAYKEGSRWWIPVDVERKKVTPPDILWHGTAEKYVHSIEQEGLIPKSRLYVHLSADMATARIVGARHGKVVIFQINAKQMHEDGYEFYKSVNGVWLTKKVPLNYLNKLK